MSFWYVDGLNWFQIEFCHGVIDISSSHKFDICWHFDLKMTCWSVFIVEDVKWIDSFLGFTCFVWLNLSMNWELIYFYDIWEKSWLAEHCLFKHLRMFKHHVILIFDSIVCSVFMNILWFSVILLIVNWLIRSVQDIYFNFEYLENVESKSLVLLLLFSWCCLFFDASRLSSCLSTITT